MCNGNKAFDHKLLTRAGLITLLYVFIWFCRALSNEGAVTSSITVWLIFPHIESQHLPNLFLAVLATPPPPPLISLISLTDAEEAEWQSAGWLTVLRIAGLMKGGGHFCLWQTAVGLSWFTDCDELLISHNPTMSPPLFCSLLCTFAQWRQFVLCESANRSCFHARVVLRAWFKWAGSHFPPLVGLLSY